MPKVSLTDGGAHPQQGQPYCSQCDYDLTGLTESPRCPECGRPLVEVLQRRGYGAGVLARTKRYRSKACLCGLPVIDVALGPAGDRRVGVARGIIAVGDVAHGFLAVGGITFGVLCVGGVNFGVVSLGGAAVGLLASLGGLSISGGLAVGACAIGTLANGSAAVGVIAQGVGAVGWQVRSVAMIVNHRPIPPVFNTLAPLMGKSSLGLGVLAVPIVYVVGLIGALAAGIGFVAARAVRRQPGKQESAGR